MLDGRLGKGDSAKLLLYVVARFPFQVGQDEKRFSRGVARHGDRLPVGLTKRRADWLVTWLRETVRSGSAAQDMSQGLGRVGLGEAFPGSAIRVVLSIQKKPGPMKIPVMLRVLMSWLADRLEGGIGYRGRIQKSRELFSWSSTQTLRPKMEGLG